MLSRFAKPAIQITRMGRSGSVRKLLVAQRPVCVFRCTVSIPYRSFSTKSEKEPELTNKILTIPNIMSGIRLALAPVIGIMTVKGLFLPSLCTFAFASVLDFADGYVARRFNQRSRLGTFIDPVADKMLMCCLALATGYSGLVHLPVACLILGKDVLMGLGFFGIAWHHGYRKPKEMMNMIKSLEVKPSMLGKTNTALQIALILLSICRPIWGFPGVQLFLPLEGLVSCTTVATLFSYAFTVNKSLKWSAPNKLPATPSPAPSQHTAGTEEHQQVDSTFMNADAETTEQESKHEKM